jgi:uncharacterized RDD family membrane protein YckC
MPKRRQTRAGGQRPSGTGAGRPGSAGGRPVSAGRPGPADRPGQPGASETRQAVERVSARPLVFLTQLPKWVLLVILLGLLISGFAVPGLIGAAALLVVGILLGWLAYLSWPSLNTQARLGRVVALVCMVIIVVWQARR